MPPRTLNRLTARQVAALKAPGRHADGGGLYLKITPAGSRSWVFFWTRDGKQREAGLGSAAAGGVTLAQAREKAGEFRKLLAEGLDPLDTRREAKRQAEAQAVKFGAFADQFVADHRPSWSNPKHADQWAMTLGPAYCKAIRDLPIADVRTEDVLRVLTPVWQSRPETARRVRMRIERILDAARVKGLRPAGTENPARWRGHLDHLLPRHAAASKGHHAAMPWGDVPDFFKGLADRSGIAAPALRFTIATAARTSEVIGAQWEEIDLEAALWTVPAARMKARRPHRVPLTGPAIEALEAVRGLHPEIVFPGPSLRRPLSNMAMAAILKRAELDFTVHGFRSAFRDWAAETTAFPSEVAEMALAHVVADATEAAYRRGDLFAKRRALMDAWAAFLTETPATNVVPIAQARA